jgi:hypothetical protein
MDPRDRVAKPAEKPLTLILVKRVAIFSFIICCVSLFYLVVGSVSSFLDETQSMLLDMTKISSLGIIVASGIGILLHLFMAIARLYRFRPLGVLGYLVVAALGGTALALSQTISILARGLR